MDTILLTGFDPFNGETKNPSHEIVQRMDSAVIDNVYRVVGRGLPTTFSTAGETLLAAIREISPSIVLCLGEAGGRTHMTPERVAINVIDARIPDNAGQQLTDVPIAADGPAAYFSRLPIKSMVRRMRAAGVPASVSNSAGTYVCNYIFYRLMHDIHTEELGIDGGFMHVPYMSEQVLEKNVASWPTEFMVRGVEAALQAIVEERRGV